MKANQEYIYIYIFFFLKARNTNYFTSIFYRLPCEILLVSEDDVSDDFK